MAKRPFWWGGGTGIELEFRDIREKDVAELSALAGLTKTEFAKLMRKELAAVVATNLGIPAGFAYKSPGWAKPMVLVKEYMKGKGIEERLERVFEPRGVKSAAFRRSTGQ